MKNPLKIFFVSIILAVFLLACGSQDLDKSDLQEGDITDTGETSSTDTGQPSSATCAIGTAQIGDCKI